MSAQYPTAVRTFATKNAGDTIQPADVNDLQDETNAVESGLINGLAHPVIPDAANTRTLGSAAKTWSAVYARSLNGAALASPLAPTDGQILVGKTSDSSLNLATLTAGAGVTITNGAGAITINTTALSARVTADVSMTTNTALADVADLTLTVVAGTKYRYRAVLFMAGDTTGGVKFGLSGTATMTNMRVSVMTWNLSSAAVALLTTMWTSLTSGSAAGAGTNQCVTIIEGAINVNAGGTLKVQFAQSAANGTSTIQTNSSVELIATTN